MNLYQPTNTTDHARQSPPPRCPHCKTDDEHAHTQPRNSTKIRFPRPSPRSHDSPTHRTDAATFLVPSHPFYYILQHSYIPRPLPKHSPSLHFHRAHRFADARTFVTLLYLDAHHTFPHHLCCVLLILFNIYLTFMLQNMLSILCHMPTYILHTNYDTQSSYKTSRITM